jgi:dihydrodipicolinate synthase/N-acetylneuraminate lyase
MPNTSGDRGGGQGRRGRVPVIAGAGSNNTVEGIDLIRHAEKVGADAALVVTPYYNKPTQAGLIAHFTALHDAATCRSSSTTSPAARSST